METIEIHSRKEFEELITDNIVDYASDEFEFCLVNKNEEEVIRVIDRANIGELSVAFREIISKRFLTI